MWRRGGKITEITRGNREVHKRLQKEFHSLILSSRGASGLTLRGGDYLLARESSHPDEYSFPRKISGGGEVVDICLSGSRSRHVQPGLKCRCLEPSLPLGLSERVNHELNNAETAKLAVKYPPNSVMPKLKLDATKAA